MPPGIFNRFHVTLLRPTATDPLPSQQQVDYQPPAISLDNDGNPEWEIKEILRARTH